MTDQIATLFAVPAGEAWAGSLSEADADADPQARRSAPPRHARVGAAGGADGFCMAEEDEDLEDDDVFDDEDDDDLDDDDDDEDDDFLEDDDEVDDEDDDALGDDDDDEDEDEDE